MNRSKPLDRPSRFRLSFSSAIWTLALTPFLYSPARAQSPPQSTREAAPADAIPADDDAPWMSIAKAELGQKELAGDDHNPRILEYLATTKGGFKTDETPWCSAFANWVMSEAGETGTNSALARSWLKWGEPIEEPRYGCLVVFKRGDSSWQGHVAFYVRSEGENLIILGGNQSNTVSIAPRSKANLLGYRWPTLKTTEE